MADRDPYHSTDFVTGYPQLQFLSQNTGSDPRQSDDPFSGGYGLMQPSRHRGTASGYASEQPYTTNSNSLPRAANPPSTIWSQIYGIAFAAALFIAGISVLAVVTAMSLPKVQVGSISVSSFNVSEWIVLGPVQLRPNKPKLLQANVIASSKKIRRSVANAILSDNKNGSAAFDVKLSFTVKGANRVTWESAGASCGSESLSKCDVYYNNKDYDVKVSGVKISPNPVKKGKPATFTISATTSESITDGKMRVDVRYFGIPVYGQDHDLCEETSCPITSGNFVVSHSEELPGFTPPVSDLYAFYIYFDECY
ncbi:hypothetical protein DKX38_010231 [Salix brachista]|uniref:MD-2-related lipid-recognition domain-containing protein n=1 Tax=Salix brachista TaxID=2182728 RepID=A0A5N5MCL3_9ROSI|nr:hypothetical protein DKX38_010231 [Salix brachista]